MTPIEACKLIVDLFEWDEDGVVQPKPPYSWMTVASIAGDYSKGALTDSTQETKVKCDCDNKDPVHCRHWRVSSAGCLCVCHGQG
jgi:hypothetical protein